MSENLGEVLILEFNSQKLDAQVKKIEESLQIKGGAGGTANTKGFAGMDKKMDLFSRALTKATESLMNFKFKSDDNKSGFGKAQPMQNMEKAFNEKGGSGQESVFNKMDKKLKGMGDSNSGILKSFASNGKMLGFLGIAAAGISAMVVQGVKSSALLQANFSIAQTAWDLTWRPFGDALGAYLIPSSISYLKWAAEFYPVATAYFKKLADGRDKIDDKIKEGDIVGVLDALLENLMVFISGKNNKDLANSTKDNTPNFSPLFKVDTGKLIQPIIDGILKAWANYTATVQAVIGIIVAPFYNFWQRVKVSVFDPISAAFAPLSTWMSELWEAIKSKALGFLDFFSGNENTGEKDAIGKAGDWLKGVIGIEDNVEGLEASMESVEMAGNVALDSATGFASKIDMVAKSGDEASGSASIMSSTMLSIASIFRAVESRARSLLSQARRAQSRNTRRFATGGIINETVEGIGLESGDNYLLGEAGAERVTPIGQSERSGGGGKVINISIPITVNGADSSNIDDTVNTLKEGIIAAVKQSLKEDGNEIVLP